MSDDPVKGIEDSLEPLLERWRLQTLAAEDHFLWSAAASAARFAVDEEERCDLAGLVETAALWRREAEVLERVMKLAKQREDACRLALDRAADALR